MFKKMSLLLLVMLLMLAAVSVTQAEPVEVLRVPSGGYWGHPSPFGFNRGPGYMRASLIFDSLVWRDSSGETIPWLATDWTLSDDQRTWTFTLREGVTWQDGQPFTAQDVAFSVQYYLDHPGSAWFLVQINQVESAQADGDYQVSITLKRPFAAFLQTIAEPMFIIPRHVWENVSDPKAYTEPDAFIGTGAYRLVEYSQAETTYLYEANPNFFLGQPYVRRIEFVPTSDNILALANGDIAAFDQFGGVTDEMLAPFTAAPYRILKERGEWSLFLHFNLKAETPLRDVRVRRAIAHAVDRQALLDRVLFGFGEVGSMGYLAPSNPFYNPDVVDYPHDPDAARALLAGAGYDGTPIKLSYSTSTSPRVVELLESNLAEVGIVIEKVALDQASLDAAAAEGNYEINLVGYGGLGGDPDVLRRNFTTDSPNTGFSRALGYSNPEFDTLASAQVSMMNPDERAAAVDQMQAILAQDVPVIPLYYAGRVVVFNADVFDNWYFTPGGWGGGVPMPFNKHQFIVGQPTGLDIRQ